MGILDEELLQHNLRPQLGVESALLISYNTKEPSYVLQRLPSQNFYREPT